MHKRNVALSILGLGLTMALPVKADITVNPLLLFFTGGDNVQDLTINNVGNKVAYVEVKPEAVFHVGTTKEALKSFAPGTDINKFGLIVSPLKMVIPVNSYRKLRVVSLNPTPKEDRLYYINVAMVPPPSEIDSQLQPSPEGDTHIMLSSSISYQVQAFILPVKPMPKVSIKRQGLNVTAVNAGNTYASLRNGTLCDEGGGNCKPLPPEFSYHLLYAGADNGNTWSFMLPHPGVVKFNLVYAKNHQTYVSSN